jgi:hypothetical protein
MEITYNTERVDYELVLVDDNPLDLCIDPVPACCGMVIINDFETLTSKYTYNTANEIFQEVLQSKHCYKFVKLAIVIPGQHMAIELLEDNGFEKISENVSTVTGATLITYMADGNK